MPRVNRFAVEFTIPSDDRNVWLAEFVHQHAREECPHIDPLRRTQTHVVMVCSHHDVKGRKLHLDPKDCPKVKLKTFCPRPIIRTPLQYHAGGGQVIPVQHITTCKLRHKGSTTFLTGVAPCSLHDEYNWRHGLHFSLQRAMEKARYCTLAKVNGRIAVTDKKPIYDEICEAFWREMQVPAAGASGEGGAAVVPQIIEATIIPSEARSALQRSLSRRHDVPHGLGAVEQDYLHVPPETRNGTYHMGTH